MGGTWKVYTAALLLTSAVGVREVSSDQQALSPADAFGQREKLMEKVGKDAKQIGDALKAGRPAGTAAPAEAIAAAMDRYVTLFPPGAPPAKSRAKPEIWAQKAEFDTIAATLKEKANAYAAAVKAGGDAKAASGPMWGQCKACHDKFRVPKKGE